MTYEELVEQIRTLPFSVAAQENPTDPDHAEDDVAAAMAEVVVAASIARAAQESLKIHVDTARRGGAKWTTIGKALGVTPWHARRRRWETRPLDAPW